MVVEVAYSYQVVLDVGLGVRCLRVFVFSVILIGSTAVHSGVCFVLCVFVMEGNCL